jgi:hypothetical protein
MSTKGQDPPSTVKAERTHQISTLHTRKFIALIQMDVDHQKIGRKKFRSPRLESESRTYTPRREYHPRGGYSSQGRGRGETKTYLRIAYFMREIHTIV